MHNILVAYLAVAVILVVFRQHVEEVIYRATHPTRLSRLKPRR